MRGGPETGSRRDETSCCSNNAACQRGSIVGDYLWAREGPEFTVQSVNKNGEHSTTDIWVKANPAVIPRYPDEEAQENTI